MSRWIAAAALTAAALAGCSFADERRSKDDALSAQEEAGTRLYWLGESFEGFPLTETDVVAPGRGHFVYGECDGESEGVDDFQCTKTQLQVQFLPFESIGWKIASGCRTVDSLRGVPTLHFGGLTLVTGDGIVKVYAGDAARDRRMAISLRAVGERRRANLTQPTQAQRRIVADACP
jgi:hypothetical protein